MSKRTKEVRQRKLRVPAVGAGAVVVALAVSALTSSGETGADADLPARATRSTEKLQSVLRALHRTWVPARVGLIFDEVKAGGVNIGPDLGDLLASSDHKYFLEGIQLAVGLRRTEMAPLLRARLRSAPAHLRAPIVRAVEQLAPWTNEELEELLSDESVAVLVAALEVAARRDARPNDAIYALLLHPERRVRAAALAAVPAEPGPADTRAMYEHCKYALGRSGTEAILALGTAPVLAESEDFLYDLLQGRDEALCAAALHALALRATPLLHPGVVHNLLEDIESPMEVRAMALLCLERTRTFDRIASFQHVWPTHPVLEYFAGRALISAGHREGVQKLLDVLDAAPEQFREVSVTVAIETQLDARRLVSWLSKTGPFSGQANWQTWYDELEELPPLKLDLPSVRFP